MNGEIHEGGCLCGSMRYRTAGPPIRVTICHCRFCQRATGSAYLVEPVFSLSAFEMTSGTLAVYQHQSEGSGKLVDVHFCPTCGTKLFLTFERFPGAVGLYAGTFDDPSWIEVRPDNAKHIFTEVARPDSILPAGIPCYEAHATTNNGGPLEPTLHETPTRPATARPLTRGTRAP